MPPGRIHGACRRPGADAGEGPGAALPDAGRRGRRPGTVHSPRGDAGTCPAGKAGAEPPRRGTPLRLVLGGLGGAALLGGLVLLAQGDQDDVRERLRTLYTLCAVLGGTLLACQVVLSLLGLGHHHDFGGGEAGHDFAGHEHHAGDHEAEHETQASWFVGVLTFRTVVAALVFFGLAGLAAADADLDPGPTLAVALAAGAAAPVRGRLDDAGAVPAPGRRYRPHRARRGPNRHGLPAHPRPTRPAWARSSSTCKTAPWNTRPSRRTRRCPPGAKVVVLAVVSSDTVEVTPGNSR